MADESLDLERIRKRAAEIGLDKLSDAHLAQLARADKGTRDRLRHIPTDLHMYDEPAHVFRADGEA